MTKIPPTDADLQPVFAGTDEGIEDDGLTFAQEVVDALFVLASYADDHGVPVRVECRSGIEIDLVADPIVSFHLGEQQIDVVDTLSVQDASELVGLSRAALHRRVLRAEERGEDTPFHRFRRSDTGGRPILRTEKAAFLAWVATWKHKPK